MENDKNFETILKQAILQDVPPNFSVDVMKKINAVELKHSAQANRFKKIFFIVFATLTVLVLVLSLFINPTNFQFNYIIDVDVIRPQYIYTIGILIPAFWLLLVFSNWLEKQRTVFP